MFKHNHNIIVITILRFMMTTEHRTHMHAVGKHVL